MMEGIGTSARPGGFNDVPRESPQKRFVVRRKDGRWIFGPEGEDAYAQFGTKEEALEFASNFSKKRPDVILHVEE